ncbi:MAG: Uncharacterised protein [Bacteroidota bacterium]|nr:MAG: Uncharacterised protein [Bacteroidota bacterium]
MKISVIYKSKYTNVTMSLIERIKKVIDDSELSSAAFADRIGVQRSSISHILSGRNKPSLDFVLKVLHAFPTLHSDWLLLGKEDTQEHIQADVSTLFPPKQDIQTDQPEIEHPQQPLQHRIPQDGIHDVKEVERVTVFYTDGTCSTYTNKK